MAEYGLVRFKRDGELMVVLLRSDLGDSVDVWSGTTRELIGVFDAPEDPLYGKSLYAIEPVGRYRVSDRKVTIPNG